MLHSPPLFSNTITYKRTAKYHLPKEKEEVKEYPDFVDGNLFSLPLPKLEES